MHLRRLRHAFGVAGVLFAPFAALRADRPERNGQMRRCIAPRRLELELELDISLACLEAAEQAF
jgi:hypothetical protein